MRPTLHCMGVALALVTVLGCNKDPGIQANETDKHAEPAAGHSDEIVLTAEAIKTAGIETATAEMRTIQDEIKLPGIVSASPSGRAIVTPVVAGKVVRIHVAPGDRVRAGQPIATIESGELASAAAQVIESKRIVLSAQALVKEAEAISNWPSPSCGPREILCLAKKLLQRVEHLASQLCRQPKKNWRMPRQISNAACKTKPCTRHNFNVPRSFTNKS